VGYGTNSDGVHVTQSNAETMRISMELALEDAGLPPDAIGYINAHGTATAHGDVAESAAVHKLFGGRTPISSLKSYFGHALGACGALEAWMTVGMMQAASFAPTLNLEVVDPACAELDYIRGEARPIDCEYAMSNNFAFGGINTSLIFKRSRSRAPSA
jgi:3-oxoacyl-[acyl-carrier-protein] synthase II